MTQPSLNEIIVQYPRRFGRAFFHLLGIEGGWVNDPVDRGGATKYGISLRFLVTAGEVDRDRDGFADFDLDFDGDIDAHDVRKLTLEHAAALYHKHFWQALDCDSFPEPIGEMLFDQGVNGGNQAARKLLQRALNRHLAPAHQLIVDGRIGPQTRAALSGVLERYRMASVVESFRDVVKDRYRAIVAADPRQRRFLNGWLNRADRLGQL
jgi:lysozyme family protein